MKLNTIQWTLLILLSAFLAMSNTSYARLSLPFITTWETTIDGDSIVIPINPNITTAYDYTINWGDGQTDSNVTGNATHVYATAGTYTVEITGQFPGIHLYSTRSSDNNDKIKSIEQWGTTQWETMRQAFYEAPNLVINATDDPNLSQVISLAGMFQGCDLITVGVSNWDVSNVQDFTNLFLQTDFQGDVSNWDVSNARRLRNLFAFTDNFNGDVSNWDVSNVIDMSGVFYNCRAFNGDISKWDVSNVNTMFRLFSGAFSFAGDISNWDVSKVTRMGSMFRGNTPFTGDLSNWDVSNVVSMEDMFWGDNSLQVTGLEHWDTKSLQNMNGIFHGVDDFNVDVSGWDVSNVTDMSGAFFGTSFNKDISHWDISNVTDMSKMFGFSSFNQDISHWDVSNVTDMSEMFEISSFNQDISSWNIQNVTDMTDIFRRADLSQENYDKILGRWSLQDVQENVPFGAEQVQYCTGGYARQQLIDNKSWVFTDGGQAAACKEIRYGSFTGELVCADSSYTAPSGKVISQTGISFDTFPSSTAGIDSVLLLDLSMPFCITYGATSAELNCIKPVYSTPSGKILLDAGVFYDTIPAVEAGVDSVMTITITNNFIQEYTQDSIPIQNISVGESMRLKANTSYSSFAQFQKSDKDWIEINSVADDIAGTNRSVFMWIRTASNNLTSTEVLLGINTSSGGNISNFQINSDERLKIYEGSSTQSSGVVVGDGQWHYVGYTYDEASNLTTFFVNGVEANSFTNEQSVTNTSQISLAQEFDGGSISNLFNGDITEVSIWNDVLQKEDILLAMSGKIEDSHPKYANLKGYYPMVQGCGESASTIVKDYSGNNNDGTAYEDNNATTAIHNQNSLSLIAGFNSQGHYSKSWTFDGNQIVSEDSTWTTSMPITGSALLILRSKDFVIKDSFAISVANQVVWDGTAWQPTAPTPANDVVIKGNYDLAVHGDISCANLFIQPGANTALEDGNSLTVTGDFVNNGTFTQAGGTVTFSGTSAQTISGSSTASFSQIEVDNSNGLTLNSGVEVTQKLTLTSGILTTNDNLTLKSTQANTAYIVYGTGSTSGNVTMERIARDNNGDLGIYAGIGRRFISSPVNNATVGTITGFTPILSGAATFNNEGPSTLTTANYPNIFLYDETRIGASDAFEKGWYAPENAGDNLPAGMGFSLEMEQSTVVSFSGPLNSGQVDVAVTNNAGSTDFSSGWHLIGNPYPSPISLKDFMIDNDAVLFGTAFVRYPSGRYSGAWGSYVAASGVSSPANIVANDALAPIQSFMVYTSSGGTASFAESHRIDPAGFNVLRTEAAHRGLIRLQLKNGERFDEAVVYLHENGSKGFDTHYDAFMVGYTQGNNLFLEAGEQQLKINAVSPDKETSLPLGVWIAETGTQTFELNELSGWDSDLEAYLEDRFTGDLVKLEEGASYSFQAEKGWQEGRFRLHLGTPKSKDALEQALEMEGIRFFAYGKAIALEAKDGKPVKLSLYSLTGVKLLEQEFQGSQRLQTDLPTGIYLLKAETGEGSAVKRVKLD